MQTKNKVALVTGASTGIGEATAQPKTHYAPGMASRLRLLRRFAPAGVLDAAVRKDLRLDA